MEYYLFAEAIQVVAILFTFADSSYKLLTQREFTNDDLILYLSDYKTVQVLLQVHQCYQIPLFLLL